MDHHICPWQHGAFLTSPVRKLSNDPIRITKDYATAGATVMDVGCGMGFFTVPMARLVGPSGLVIAVDVQEQMLAGMQKNAAKAGCSNITPHLCNSHSLEITQWDGTVDFAVVFHMLHEAPDPQGLIGEVFTALKPGGALLFAEPILHVGKQEFEQEATLFANAGFVETTRPHIGISRAIVWRKPR